MDNNGPLDKAQIEVAVRKELEKVFKSIDNDVLSYVLSKYYL